jgi:hypothetical protein
MTSRERVLCAVQQKPVDRVPVDIWARPSVWQNLRDYLGLEEIPDILKKIGIDIVNMSPGFIDREFSQQRIVEIPGDSEKNGTPCIEVTERAFRDQWGVTYGLNESFTDDYILDTPLHEPDIPDAYVWPDISSLESVESYTKRIQDAHDTGFCVFSSILNPFKQAWQLRGFENFLVDMMLNKRFAEDLMNQLREYSVMMALRSIEAGADVICIMGDVAGQQSMFFSPDLFSEMIAPHFDYILRKSKAVADVPFFFHSDGNIMSIMPKLMELGFSVVNPIQPESMDPLAVRSLYKNKLTLHGTISVQTVLHQEEAVVRETVRSYIRALRAKEGGVILAPTNVLTPDIPIGNILAFYDEVMNQ